MAKLIIEMTPEQVKEFASWYSGQGEQDADIWFDINGVPTPWTDDSKTIHHENGDITMVMKSS